MKDTSPALGDRLKGYEAQYEKRVPVDNHIIVRLDGHGFQNSLRDLKAF